MPTSRTILLAIDATPGSEKAIELLEAHRNAAAAASIVVLNVQARPLALWPEAGLDMSAIEAELLADGEQLVERAVARLRASGMKAAAAVRLGIPAQGILQEAQSCGAAMVVMGTRGHGAVHGLAMGSVAMRVAHGSALPVCLVRPQTRIPARLGASLRVMLALDGSQPALRAASLLASWRDWLGELEVELLYVQPPLSFLETLLPPHDDVIRQWSTRAGEEATQPARQLLEKEGIKCRVHLSVGDAATEIVHVADEAGCELLVLGTRGLGAAHHALLGSVALKAAAHASIPVLLVK